MRFAWVARETPLHPDSGALIYSNGLIRSLLATGAKGTLISYSRPGVADGRADGLELQLIPPPRRIRALSLLSNLQSDAYRLKSDGLAELLRHALMRGVDALVIDYFSMGWVLSTVDAAVARGAKRPVLVHISHNYEADVRRQVANDAKNPLLRSVMKIDAEKAAKIEHRLARACDLIVANTDEDNRSFQRDVPGKSIITLMPAYDGDIVPTRPITGALPRRAVITGAFDWIAKQFTLRRFLEIAEAPFQKAGIELLVVGRADPAFLAELSQRYSFAKFTGRVDDVRPYMQDARIGIMPDDIGGGFKHKYLYYIFAGLPVATIRSQFAGMPLDIDRDVIARDNIKDLVQAVADTIDDIPMLEGMRERCWGACSKVFNWSDRGQRLRQSIDALLDEKRRGEGHEKAAAGG